MSMSARAFGIMEACHEHVSMQLEVQGLAASLVEIPTLMGAPRAGISKGHGTHMKTRTGFSTFLWTGVQLIVQLCPSLSAVHCASVTCTQL
jgi:hypothetical protein